MDNISFGIIIVLILILSWTFKKMHSTRVILFHRPTCGACKQFRPDWNKFKSKLPWMCDAVEINSSDPSTTALLDNYDVKTVPSIWKVLPDGSRYQFQGDRTLSDMLLFVSTN